MSDKFVSWEDAVTWLLAQPDKQQLVMDCYYDGTPQSAAERYWNSDEWAAIRTFLPSPTGRAIDLGAGRGIASYALAKDGWEVISVEPDTSCLVGGGAIRNISQSEGLSITVIEEFGEGISRESDSVDLVFARQVLHHARDLPGLCRELFRLMKPGGTLVAVRDHVINSRDELDSFLKMHPLHQLYGGENAYTRAEYLDALRAAGFKVEKVMGSFDSVINYAPYNDETLKAEIKHRMKRFPLGTQLGCLLDISFVYRIMLMLLSWFDPRPGRLYSFICIKPLGLE